VGQVAALEPILFVKCGVPMNAVLRMVILGRAERLDANRALQLGLVSEVVPDDQLVARAQELGEQAAAASPAAVEASLRAIWGSLDHSLSDAYNLGYHAIGAHRSHPDAIEGAAAFVDRRTPVWSESR
jgi:enoyl-CoA hydratase/carnithine racemase